MQLRGPGDILGTQQSGMVDFKRLDLVNDGNIIKAAKRNCRTFAKNRRKSTISRASKS